jgi:hypothetical protein
MRYQFAVLPGPPFQVAQESGQKGSHDCNVYQLCLPMQHLDPLPMTDALGRIKYPRGAARPTSPFGVIREICSISGFELGQTRFAERAAGPSEAVGVPAREGHERDTVARGMDHPAVAEIDPGVVDL